MKSITATEHLKADTVLRVYKRGFGYAKITLVDVNEYFLAAWVPEDLYSHVQEGDVLDAYLWKEDVASYEFPLLVKGKALVKVPVVLCAHTGEISATKERKCLTAKVSIPVKFYPISVNHAEKSFYTEKIVMHQGTMREISDRDAVLAGDLKMPVGQLLNGHVHLGGAGDIEFSAKVVSGSAEGPGSVYHVEYLGMHEKERAGILDYIFTVYRE